MVESEKYTEEWAAEKAGGEKYVNIACDGGVIACPFEWLKFKFVAEEKEEGDKAVEEGAAPAFAGYVYDSITVEDAELENFPHDIQGCEEHPIAVARRAMEYFEKVAELGEDCRCPPPLKKSDKSNDHLKEKLAEEKSESDKDQSHWYTYINSMDDTMLLKVLSFANKLGSQPLMRLASMKVTDRIYNCTMQEARDFLGFKVTWTPEQEKDALAKVPGGFEWPHGKKF